VPYLKILDLTGPSLASSVVLFKRFADKGPVIGVIDLRLRHCGHIIEAGSQTDGGCNVLSDQTQD
jgi:hypothetical protein